MRDEGQEILTLEEGMAQPRKHRDMGIAKESMPNFSSTPGGLSTPRTPRRQAVCRSDRRGCC